MTEFSWWRLATKKISCLPIRLVSQTIEKVSSSVVCSPKIPPLGDILSGVLALGCALVLLVWENETNFRKFICYFYQCGWLPKYVLKRSFSRYQDIRCYKSTSKFHLNWQKKKDFIDRKKKILTAVLAVLNHHNISEGWKIKIKILVTKWAATLFSIFYK